MPGDYSRKTFEPTNHYSGVLWQEGRVQLDADENEQLDIQHYRDETEAIDVIGNSGVPKKNDGFKIAIASGGADLTIAAGRYYVEGLLCELEQVARYSSQPYRPHPEFTSTANPPVVSIPTGKYVVVLDAWKREITALDDKAIREVALNGPDTTTRLQNVWQVRLIDIGIAPQPPTITCKSSLPGYDTFSAPSTGTLNARTQPPQPTNSPCLLPPGTGYSRLENQLYRVEVQKGGTQSQTTFKWSRDNASVETTISNAAGNVLTVDDIGKDEVLSFASGQWVEIVSEESTLKSTPNALVQIQSLGPGAKDITLTSSVAAFAGVKNLKLRRWDQTGTNAGVNGVSASLTTWIDLEDGIQVSFSTSGNFRAGDYWLIPARTATGDIEWPRDETAAKNPIAQTPKGIIHHYCKLALVASTNGQLSLIEDCRKRFPALTEICAVDVCFDDNVCDFGDAKTVQDALNDLCRREQKTQCTFIVAPGDDVQAVFDSIGKGADAEVCFQAGKYFLNQPIRIEEKGDLKISGIGYGTRFRAPKAESAFQFVSCRSVLVRDISAQTDAARANGDDETAGLNGTLTFLDCNKVNVESVWLKCGSAPSRVAACITVRNREDHAGTARVQHCFLQPGHQQTGILLVNVTRSQVEDNIIRAKEHVRLNPNRSLEDRQHFGNVRGLLVREIRFGPILDKHDNSNFDYSSGNFEIHFRTDTRLTGPWERLLRQHPVKDEVRSPRALAWHVTNLATRLLVDQEFRKEAADFDTYLEGVFQGSVPVGSQGITVGGGGATEVRIINNTIERFMQGIHVGLSKEADSTRYPSQMVTISGNNIFILLTSVSVKRDRHGIFVGNCTSLLIDNNKAWLTRLFGAEKLDIDGIRVWGELGDRALVTQNHLASVDGNPESSFTNGINMHPLLQNDRFRKHWLVNFNVAPSRARTVLVYNGAEEERNVPAHD
jgi:hypothetical protein